MPLERRTMTRTTTMAKSTLSTLTLELAQVRTHLLSSVIIDMIFITLPLCTDHLEASGRHHYTDEPQPLKLNFGPPPSKGLDTSLAGGPTPRGGVNSLLSEEERKMKQRKEKMSYQQELQKQVRVTTLRTKLNYMYMTCTCMCIIMYMLMFSHCNLVVYSQIEQDRCKKEVAKKEREE